jgi:ribosomal protein S19E (S16A)
MNAEFDHELTHDQWETLKSLRIPARGRRSVNRFIVDQLIALGLAAMTEGTAFITPAGRKVLIRGSCRLLDLAA